MVSVVVTRNTMITGNLDIKTVICINLLSISYVNLYLTETVVSNIYSRHKQYFHDVTRRGRHFYVTGTCRLVSNPP
jgi:hypothetical protein